MSFQATAVNIMIAYPSDVEAERGYVRDEIQKWNDLNSQYLGVVLLARDWRTHSIPGFGQSAQQQIDETVLNQADILIALFWTRVGTPTDNDRSGTIGEIRKHVALGKRAMLYFSRSAIPYEVATDHQYEDLELYKRSISQNCLYDHFKGEVELRNHVRTHLTRALQDSRYLKHLRPKADQEPSLDTIVPAQQITRERADLGDEERTLLKAASLSGDGLVLQMESFDGASIRANNQEFVLSQTRREISRWLGAIRKLEMIGFLRPLSESRDFFELTQSGYARADDLLRDEPLELLWYVKREGMKQDLKLEFSKPVLVQRLGYFDRDVCISTDEVDVQGVHFSVQLAAQHLVTVSNLHKGEPSSITLMLAIVSDGQPKKIPLPCRRAMQYFSEGSVMNVYQQVIGKGELTLL